MKLDGPDVDAIVQVGTNCSMVKLAAAAEMYLGKPVIAIVNTWSDINHCHTHFRQRAEEVKRGIWQAGGFPLETPFGVIYTTNITPDVETGIGTWSLEAFTRAMREGVDREGEYLYPEIGRAHV